MFSVVILGTRGEGMEVVESEGDRRCEITPDGKVMGPGLPVQSNYSYTYELAKTMMINKAKPYLLRQSNT